MTTPTLVDEAALPVVLWDDPVRGTIRFRTLISAPQTDTSGIVCGVAMMALGDRFEMHAHPEPEVYFGLTGVGEVVIDGAPHRLAPGVALYIPGGAMHGITVLEAPLKWTYIFAADSLADIRYHFASETPDD